MDKGKTYTLAEILADHMDAVKEGRVQAWGNGYLRLLADLGVVGWSDTKPPAFASGHTQVPPIDGYTIEEPEPKVVEDEETSDREREALRIAGSQFKQERTLDRLEEQAMEALRVLLDHRPGFQKRVLALYSKQEREE